MKEGVDLGGGQLGKTAMAAASVIGDEDVEGPERLERSCDDALRSRHVGEVRFDERHDELAGDCLRPAGVGAPALRCVV